MKMTPDCLYSVISLPFNVSNLNNNCNLKKTYLSSYQVLWYKTALSRREDLEEIQVRIQGHIYE